jgi:hypothetical protein
MDSDDLEFLQLAASALDMSDEEYSDFTNEMEEVLAEDESPYELDYGWPDDEWLDPGDWYEVTAGYSDEE